STEPNLVTHQVVRSEDDKPTVAVHHEAHTVANVQNQHVNSQTSQKSGLSMWVWIGGGAAAAIILAVAIIGSIFLFGNKADDKPVPIEPDPNKPVVTEEDPEPVTPPPVQQVAVPDVVNSFEEDAKTLLEEQGLIVGEITYIDDRYAPKGLVLKQSVQADQQVDEQTPVNLEIAKGI